MLLALVGASSGSCLNQELQEGEVLIETMAPVTGLYYYAVPCVFENLTVHREGNATALLDGSSGQWPSEVNDDELDTYPHLHFLEERKAGSPWRLERWYTLASRFLIFESEQYLERSCPKQHGKDWERLIVQLRQVTDVTAWTGRTAGSATHLLH